MDRLTAQWGENHAVPTKFDLEDFAKLEDPEWNGITDIMDRLAAYEDTGLEPDEIPHWIPVSERLPGHGERVLAYSPEMDGTEADIQVSKGFMVRRKRSDITHWMPLPQPPKDGAK